MALQCGPHVSGAPPCGRVVALCRPSAVIRACCTACLLVTTTPPSSASADRSACFCPLRAACCVLHVACCVSDKQGTRPSGQLGHLVKPLSLPLREILMMTEVTRDVPGAIHAKVYGTKSATQKALSERRTTLKGWKRCNDRPSQPAYKAHSQPANTLSQINETRPSTAGKPSQSQGANQPTSQTSQHDVNHGQANRSRQQPDQPMQEPSKRRAR